MKNNHLDFTVSSSVEDWVDRMDAACKVLEQRFSTSLNKVHLGTKRDMRSEVIEDRRKFLKSRLKNRGRSLSIYSGAGLERTETGFRNVSYIALGGAMREGGVYQVGVVLPDEVDDREQLKALLHSALTGTRP